MKGVISFLKINFILISICFHVTAQVIPGNHALLTRTQVLFDYAYSNHLSDQYRLQVYCDSGCGTEAPLVMDTFHRSQAIRLDTPFVFGNKYSWKFTQVGAHREALYISDTRHFTILDEATSDTGHFKIEVLKTAPGNAKRLVFLDGAKIAVDGQGKRVWFYSGKAGKTLRDISLTTVSTVTSIGDREAEERDLDGNLLWLAPDDGSVAGDTTERYHHDFTRARDGNYMVCGQKTLRAMDGDYANELTATLVSSKPGTRVPTVIEYGADKKVKWSFDMATGLKRSLNIDINNQTITMLRVGHLNGICTDDSNKYVYASFKTFNNIFKIEKKTNRIAYIFGNKNIDVKDSTRRFSLFAAQHCPTLSRTGNLLIFNNNGRKPSSIIELKNQPDMSKQDEVLWEYKFDFEDGENFAANMGSVQELNNGNLFVGGGALNKLFEMTRQKEIVWYARSYQNEHYGSNLPPRWVPLQNYRSCYASSLYPFYFTLQPLVTTTKPKNIQKGISFAISNNGSEQDEYTFRAEDENQKKISNPGKATIPAGGHISKTLEMKPGDAREIVVYVQSKSNKVEKKLTFTVR